MHKLTAIKVAAARKPGYLSDGGNLYLRIASGGSKSWAFRYVIAGRARDAGLGPYPVVSLNAARTEAEKFRQLVAGGVDPIEVRRNERQTAVVASAKSVTFEACARAFVASREAGWRNSKHRAQWHSTLKTYVYPIAGALPVQNIDTNVILSVLQPLWASKPETASRVRGRIEAVLNSATARGYRDGACPARWRGHLDQILPAKSKVRRVKHHASLPYAELPEFMAKLRKSEGISARALEFTILAAARTGEALGATFDECDLDAKLWTVPAERMKGGRGHRVALCSRAVAIVMDMAEMRVSEFIFPGMKPGRPLSNMALLMLLRDLRPGITTHGFRSAFKDWCTERTNFPDHVSEAALAHVSSDRVRAAYARSDLVELRRQLMEEWGRFCGKEPAAVLRLDRRQA
ncbi:MAG: tyrosine-type recombinase/integrase [Hyphomicrobiaceae bacterium]